MKKGQALIEVLVAISVLTVGLLGIVTLLNRALSLNRVISDNYTATYLAAEGLEIAKNIIDANVLQGRPWNDPPGRDDTFEVDFTSTAFGLDQNRFLSFDPSTGRYSYTGTVRTSFRRDVSTELIGRNEIRVTSEVTWTTRGGGSFSVDLEDHFYNWRP